MVKLGVGNFIKSKDLQGGEQITFQNEGEWQENTRYKYPDGNPRFDFVCDVQLGEEKKSMRLNKTNRDILSHAWGTETKDWVGKSATIKLENCLVGGKRTKTIILMPDGKEVNLDEVNWDDN